MDTKNTYDVTKFDRPSVTVDVLFFTIKDGKLQILLIKRASWPYKNYWALPGGFVQMKETLEEAAKREIFDECGVKNLFLEQLFTFGDVKRDPRTRVITVAYYALSPWAEVDKIQKSEVREALYFPVDKLPKLAFDHKKIIEVGYERLKSKLSYSNIAFGLLPELFPLSELQKIYEIILVRKLDKRNFRKWIVASGLVVSTGKINKGLAHRPAVLYKFSRREVVTLD